MVLHFSNPEDVDRGVISAYTVLTFHITHDPESAALTANYWIDFGDGNGQQQIFNKNDINHAFAMPGRYIVTAYLKEADSEIPVGIRVRKIINYIHT